MTKGHPRPASVSVCQVLKDPLTTEVLIGSYGSFYRVPTEVLIGCLPCDVENSPVTVPCYHSGGFRSGSTCIRTISKVELVAPLAHQLSTGFVCGKLNTCSSLCAQKKKARATSALACGFVVGREGVEPSTLGLRVDIYRAIIGIIYQINYISAAIAAKAAVATTLYQKETIEYELKSYSSGSCGSYDQLRTRYRTQTYVCDSVMFNSINSLSNIVFNIGTWRHHGMACGRDGRPLGHRRVRVPQTP